MTTSRRSHRLLLRRLTRKSRKKVGVVAASLMVAALTVALPQAVATAADGEARLATDVSGHSPADGENLRLDSVAVFNAEGGWALIEPGTDWQEVVGYRSIEAESNELVSIRRLDGRSHPQGALVKPTRGTITTQAISATSDADAARVAVESVRDFDPNGGWAVFEPGAAAEEEFSYSSVDGTTNERLGISRDATRDYAPRVFGGVIDAKPSDWMRPPLVEEEAG